MPGFQSLPLEMREMIYHFLWIATPRATVFDDQGLKYTIDYLPETQVPLTDEYGNEDIGQVLFVGLAGSPNSSQPSEELSDDGWEAAEALEEYPGLPQWLFTTKVIREEALKVFERIGLATLEVEAYALSRIDGEIYDPDVLMKYPTIAPFNVRQLRLVFVQYGHPSAWRQPAMMQMGHREIEYCEGLFDDMCETGLTKKLDFRMMPFKHVEESRFKIDLRDLGYLFNPLVPQLKRLKLRLRAQWTDLANDFIGNKVDEEVEKEVAMMEGGSLEGMEWVEESHETLFVEAMWEDWFYAEWRHESEKSE